MKLVVFLIAFYYILNIESLAEAVRRPCGENVTFCELGPWLSWGRCDQYCGGGTQTRRKAICCDVNQVKSLDQCLNVCKINKDEFNNITTDSQVCGTRCYNGGKFNITENKCDCVNGSWGKCCRQNENECRSNPCKHGRCYDRFLNYNCYCYGGYSGRNCENSVCDKHLCENNGTCHIARKIINHRYRYIPQCRCTKEYDGNKCQDLRTTTSTSSSTSISTTDDYSDITLSDSIMSTTPEFVSKSVSTETTSTAMETTDLHVTSATTTFYLPVTRNRLSTQRSTTKSLTSTAHERTKPQTTPIPPTQITTQQITSQQATTKTITPIQTTPLKTTTKQTSSIPTRQLTTSKPTTKQKTTSKSTTQNTTPEHTIKLTTQKTTPLPTTKLSIPTTKLSIPTTKLTTPKVTTQQTVSKPSTQHTTLKPTFQQILAFSTANKPHSFFSPTNVVLQIDAHICDSSPCVNGVCIPFGQHHMCYCSPGYIGQNCQLEKNECENEPCSYGHCVDKLNDYECECNMFFHGRNCQKMKWWGIGSILLGCLVLLMLCSCCVFCIPSRKRNDDDDDDEDEAVVVPNRSKLPAKRPLQAWS